ncbi:HEAT repeat domain-containing protein, partial [Pseudanabaenaceae cyanobacterium LEGE 13415]|nr:HEAT repeat domain-containing protein [Pseudanabaenaceae cyanobacterium LEGE 13415]
LLGLLKDSDSFVRRLVAAVLDDLDDFSFEGTIGLISLLKDDDPEIRFQATIALAHRYDASTETRTQLIKLLKQDTEAYTNFRTSAPLT